MECRKLIFTGHALKRMFDRRVHEEEVATVARSGEVIEEYPQDTPFPSFLILGLIGEQPLHVVIGVEASTRICYIVTVYRPDPSLWDSAFRIRRIK